MAFENISKGKFQYRKSEFIYPAFVDNLDGFCIEIHDLNNNKQSDYNAEFIAFCFNLQQKYDISKFEECVDLISKITVKLLYGFDIKQDSEIHKQILELLKEVKK